MDDKVIYFLLSSVQDSHCHKRIQGFINQGFSVKVFGFQREADNYIPIEVPYQVHILGKTVNSRKFISRFRIIYRGLKQVTQEFDKSNLFYFFGIDVAFVGLILGIKNYIYEECDLVHTYFHKYLSIKSSSSIPSRMFLV